MSTAKHLWFILILLLGLPLLSWGVVTDDWPKVIASTCRLAWNAPTKNTDGTPLTNLANYQIFLATTLGGYTQTPSATIAAPATSTSCASFGAITPGKYFVIMKAVNTTGRASVATPELDFEIITVSEPPSELKIEVQGTFQGTMTITPAPLGETP